MSETLTSRFTRYRFIVEIEADPHDECLVPADPTTDAASACRRVLADEITSNLQSLHGIGGVAVTPIDLANVGT